MGGAIVDWSEINAEADLRWYFGGQAEAELGARSVQGGFEAAMHRMALCGPCGPGQMPVHETRGGAPDLEVTERQLAAARRAHHVRERLDALAGRTRAVLELHFGDSVEVLGVSLSLLCQTTRIVSVVESVNGRRGKRGQLLVDARRVVTGMVLDESMRPTLDAMVAEAQGALDAAVKEYRG